MKKYKLFSVLLSLAFIFGLFGTNFAFAENCASTDQYNSETGQSCRATSGTTTRVGNLPLGCNDPYPKQKFSVSIANTPCVYTYTSVSNANSNSRSTATTNPKITSSLKTVASGRSVKFNFTFPSNTVKATLYIVCPVGVSTQTSPEICNTYIPITSRAEWSSSFYNTTRDSQNIVANYYIYKSDNPTYAVGVSTQLKVSPVKTSQSTVSTSCTDSDGGVNINIAGTADARVNGVGSYFKDSSVNSNGGQCSGANCTAVSEGYCSNNVATNYLYQCPSGYSVGGACATKPATASSAPVKPSIFYIEPTTSAVKGFITVYGTDLSQSGSNVLLKRTPEVAGAINSFAFTTQASPHGTWVQFKLPDSVTAGTYALSISSDRGVTYSNGINYVITDTTPH